MFHVQSVAIKRNEKFKLTPLGYNFNNFYVIDGLISPGIDSLPVPVHKVQVNTSRKGRAVESGGFSGASRPKGNANQWTRICHRRGPLIGPVLDLGPIPNQSGSFPIRKLIFPNERWEITLISSYVVMLCAVKIKAIEFARVSITQQPNGAIPSLETN